ncbi:DUF3592 domain-containing protein [Denitromonas iodatirespirans]|nr:DUF3592 domain-containing protein [Denitromonas iodatirespirans]
MLLKQVEPPLLIVFSGALLGAFYTFVFLLPRYASSRKWPSVSGEVVRSELSKKTTRGTGTTVSKVYEALVEYSYMIGGKSFTSRRIEFLYLRSNSESFHQKLLSHYPLGAQVQVFYNPDKPSEAVLKPGISSGGWFLVAFLAIVLSVLGITIFVKTHSA